MRLLTRLVDKLLFTAILLLTLQLPQLADHYRQHIAGRHAAVQWQVEGYAATAARHQYASVEAMISHHLQNNTASVRTDARQKQATLAEYQQLSTALDIFTSQTLVQQLFYMLNPTHYAYLQQTLVNFTPGIPLSPGGLSFGIILALLLHLMITQPLGWLLRRKRTLIAERAANPQTAKAVHAPRLSADCSAAEQQHRP